MIGREAPDARAFYAGRFSRPAVDLLLLLSYQRDIYHV